MLPNASDITNKFKTVDNLSLKVHFLSLCFCLKNLVKITGSGCQDIKTRYREDVETTPQTMTIYQHNVGQLIENNKVQLVGEKAIGKKLCREKEELMKK
ncbi:hypothetical protein GWI33_020790 [Rhynchophorus ferrugineus]|uniref:Uncharacterized protein n=1 Tax=Rhynchophorus ferrugineus TaxID=354439 RepID=A0A834I2F0_RHYFE|nr:hypothetical protein GWI33_020790 [Rhynchophorus ferrugineus]